MLPAGNQRHIVSVGRHNSRTEVGRRLTAAGNQPANHYTHIIIVIVVDVDVIAADRQFAAAKLDSTAADACTDLAYTQFPAEAEEFPRKTTIF